MLVNKIMLEELRQIMSEAVDKVLDKRFGQKPENPEDMRATKQRSANLTQDARQPRLVTEADVTTYTKTT